MALSTIKVNKVFVILSTLIICSSCSSEQLEKNSASTKIDAAQEPIEVIDELKEEVENELKNQYFSYKDTVFNGTYKYQMDFSIWLRDEKDFSQFEKIERNGDSLIFRTAKKRLVLVNEEFDEETQNFEAPAYRFVKFYEKANVAEVQVQAYEYSYHVLVDMNSGDSIVTYGKPLFNNDNSIIFASNVDLDVQYTENGFQIIKKDSNGFKLIKTILLNDWGIAKASWISKNRLLISKATIDEKYDKHYKPGVLSLDIK